MPRPRRRQPGTVPFALTNIVHWDEDEELGMKKGDRVTITAGDEADEKWSKGTWEILRFAENVENGAQWVEVYGGMGKATQVRAVPRHTIAMKVDRRRT